MGGVELCISEAASRARPRVSRGLALVVEQLNPPPAYGRWLLVFFVANQHGLGARQGGGAGPSWLIRIGSGSCCSFGTGSRSFPQKIAPVPGDPGGPCFFTERARPYGSVVYYQRRSAISFRIVTRCSLATYLYAASSSWDLSGAPSSSPILLNSAFMRSRSSRRVSAVSSSRSSYASCIPTVVMRELLLLRWWVVGGGYQLPSAILDVIIPTTHHRSNNSSPHCLAAGSGKEVWNIG